jgi:Fe-S cluster biogenesis protein NfuA
MEEKIRKTIDETIRPMLQSHGGNIELVSVVGGVVSVKLQGACSGCPHAAATLKQFVEAELRKAVPEIAEVKAV